MRDFENFILEVGEKPQGIIQIIHGMGEHIDRYENFTNFFKKEGYLVLGVNNLFHGKDYFEKDELGNFTGEFENLISYQLSFTEKIKKEYPDIPIYILGHSMGSFIAQGHMKKNLKNISGYIIQGSSYKEEFLWKSGKILSFIVDFIFKNKKVGFFKKIIFFGYNNKFKSEFDEFSWLTGNKNEREKYKNDVLSDFDYSSKFYYEFFKFINTIYEKKSFDKVSRELKILFISGELDPVGQYGEGVKKLYNFYKKLNFKNLNIKIFEEFRHEPHNELENKEYYNYILNWLKK